MYIWRYSVVVITRDFDMKQFPETQVRTLVSPLLFGLSFGCDMPRPPELSIYGSHKY